MAASQHHLYHEESRLKKFSQTVRRAYVEFLRLPSFIIGGLLVLAAVTSVLDSALIGWLDPLRSMIRMALFRDAAATSALLATIAGSIITVTSITLSLLLLAVQQAAGALTPVVYDQFLRRRVNQIYFGFFVGLAVYTLVILATVNPPYNPVFGATLALLLTIIALMLIILLLYTTVNQMRPIVVIEAIHDHILSARECQLDLLNRTRRSARLEAPFAVPVRASEHGYVVRLDLDILSAATAPLQDNVEILLHVSVGHYVAFEDMLATVRATSAQAAADAAKALHEAIGLEQQRDLDSDPAYGVEQLAIIGWTSISTAKSNPSPGTMVLQSLRDVMARWSAEHAAEVSAASNKPNVPLVYADDVFTKLLDAFETLAVVASESMQPQTMAELVRTFALMFERLPTDQQPRAEALIRSSLSALGEHVLTAELDAALSALGCALAAAGRQATATEVRLARATLRASIGKLGSRATRMRAAD